MAQVVVVSVQLNADQDWYIELADLVTGKLAWSELDRFREATALRGEQIGELIHEGEKSTEGLDTLTKQRERIAELESAIRATIEENLQLADGDACTLKLLKDAISYR